MTTTTPVTIVSAEQALTLVHHQALYVRAAPLDEVALVAYAGSLAEHHGSCWRVGSCHCEPCSSERCASACAHNVLVTLNGTALEHVRRASFTALDVEDDQVPPILRSCAGCEGEPGCECDPFCLAGQAP